MTNPEFEPPRKSVGGSVTNVKAGVADGLSAGQFEALVSVIGNKDSYGDVVMDGAFDESLAEWKASGNPLPIIWSHGYSDPKNHIGYALDVAQKTIGDKTGLWVKGQLDIEPGTEHENARKTAHLLRQRRVTQFSFSYDVLDAAMEKSEELGDYYALRKVRLYEVGPTLIGANQETELLNAKAFQAIAAEVKSGRVISAKNEGLLRTAHDALVSVLSALDSEDGKAIIEAAAKNEEPARAKFEELMFRSRHDVRLLEIGL